MNGPSLVRWLGLIVGLGTLACTNDLVVNDVAVLRSFEPVFISASWSAPGSPQDRKDIQPLEFKGRLCPSSSVILRNHVPGGIAGLTIINSCTITVTYAVCVAKGSLPQPFNGLDQCATDPFDTPMERFTFVTLNPGPEGFGINATQNLSLVVFYCSDETVFTSPRARCIG